MYLFLTLAHSPIPRSALCLPLSESLVSLVLSKASVQGLDQEESALCRSPGTAFACRRCLQQVKALIEQGRSSGGSKFSIPKLPFAHEDFAGSQAALSTIGEWMLDAAASSRVLVVSGPQGYGKYSSVTVAAKRVFSGGGFPGGVFHIDWPEFVEPSQMDST